MDDPLEMNSPNIDLHVSKYSANQTVKSEFVKIQANTIERDFILQQVHYKYQKYKAPPHFTFASSVVSIMLYETGNTDSRIHV